MAQLFIRVLGPFQASLDGEPVSGFSSDKVRALLAYLVLTPNQPHRREALAGLLWPKFPEHSARANLRNALANLRNVLSDRDTLSPFLLCTHQTIQFNGQSDYWLDAATFEDLVADAVPRCEALEQAVGLVRGLFLEGFSLADAAPFEEWLLLRREHFGRQVVEALYRLADIYEGRGAYEQALVHVRRLVDMDPWQEEGQQQLMRLLARSGQRNQALARYEKLCRSLRQELGTVPSAATRALYEDILSGEFEQEPARHPLHPIPIWNLPASATPFFGRTTELEVLEDKLTEPTTRLVTLIGLGGSGKTRLALEVGSRFIERDRQALSDDVPLVFPHGVIFVSLAALDSIEGLGAALADTLRLRLEGGKEQLLEFLRHKQLLLILDNLEQLSRAAGFLAEIGRAAPGVKIMATSRERVQAQGEHVLSLGGLPYPQRELDPGMQEKVELEAWLATYPALQLLAEGIRRVRACFSPNPTDLSAMLDICRLVDGLPLALELAAAWADALSLEDILDEARRGLDFWQVDWPELPERQRSIRAVFDVSWRRLDPTEQTLFSSLTVFRGGFVREAAGEVAAGTELLLRLLAVLVRKSFLHYDRSRDRYQIHELLRQYGAEKLAQEPGREAEIRDRHSAYHARGLEKWSSDLKGPRQLAALSQMEVDHENIRTAWEWGIERGQIERLAQMMDGFQSFYWRRGRYLEGAAAFRRVTGLLAKAGQVPAPLLSRALAWRSSYCQALGRTEQAALFQREALALLEKQDSRGQDTRPEKALLYWLMGRRVHVSDYDQARQFYQQSLELYRQCDDSWGTANVLHSLSSIARLKGTMSEAWRLCEESLAIRHVLGDKTGIAKSTVYLAEIALHQGRYEESERLARDSIAQCRQLGDQAERAYGLHILGVALESNGRFGEGLYVQEQSLDVFNEMGRRHYVAAAQSHVASTRMHLGQYEEAQDQALACLVLAQETDLTFKITQAQRLLGALALAAGEYAECRRRAQASLAISGQTGHGIETGLAHVLLALAAHGQGTPGSAKPHLCSALEIVLKSGASVQFLWTLAAVALVLADLGVREQAVEVYSLLQSHGHVTRSRWFADIVGEPMTAVITALPPAIAANAQKRGRSCDLATSAAEVLKQLAH